MLTKLHMRRSRRPTLADDLRHLKLFGLNCVMLLLKSELAEEFHVTRARISQLVRRGLPVRAADQKIDLELAARWVLANSILLKAAACVRTRTSGCVCYDVRRGMRLLPCEAEETADEK